MFALPLLLLLQADPQPTVATTAAPPAATTVERPLSAQLVYFAMVDRFADGSPNLPDVKRGTRGRFWGGDLQGLRAKLPYLKSLGITLLWLTPLHMQVATPLKDGTVGYHGYWPERFDAIDPHFGGEDDLHALIKDAEAHGMGVVVDVVTNHTGYGARLARDPAFCRTADESCGDTDLSRCLFDLPDLKSEDPHVASFVIDHSAWWAERFALAGFRYDAFKHVEPSIFRAIRERAHKARGAKFITVAEWWGAEPGDPVLASLVQDESADTAFDFGLMGLARDFLTRRMRPQAFAHHLKRRHDTALLRREPPMLTFLDNHDTETFVHAVGPRLAPLGAVLLMTTRGVPVITWGNEVLREGGKGDPENRSFMPWDRVHEMERDPQSSLALWRALAALRHRSLALRSDELEVMAAHQGNDGSGYVVFERRGGKDRALVAIALGRPLLHVQAGVPGIEAIVHTGDASAALNGTALTLSVPPDGALVVQLTPQTTPQATPQLTSPP